MPRQLPRLLLITSDWPPPGAAVRRTAESLQAAGLSVEVFAFCGRSLYDLAAAWTRLRPRLHPGRYDVVHAQDSADGLLAFPKRVPLVMTVGKLQFIARMLVRRADAVVVPSEEIGRQLHTRATVHVMPPGLDETARAAWLVDVYQSVAKA
jgi:hypothetical protein